MGNTDIEDALQRLDKLTQEEARMANAEHLRIAHNIEGGMIRVSEGVQDVGRGVPDVGDRVKGVHHEVQDVDKKVQDVRDTVQDVSDGIQDVRNSVQDVGEGVQGVQQAVQGVDDKVDQFNRESSNAITLPLMFNPHKSSQGTTSDRASKLGSLLQIHPQTITLLATLNIKEQPNGSFAAQFSINGNLLVLYCGYMENMCSSYHSPCHQV
jgi:uncharacterized protein YoxC